MLHKSAISSRLANAEPTATKMPVTRVAKKGVRKRGWTRENSGGSKPSRDIDIRIRGWPSWNTSSTAV